MADIFNSDFTSSGSSFAAQFALLQIELDQPKQHDSQTKKAGPLIIRRKTKQDSHSSRESDHPARGAQPLKLEEDAPQYPWTRKN